MNYILLTGMWGGLVAVVGAAYPEEKVKNPLHSTKNWLLGIGAFLLLIYASLNYAFASGSFFFILLEALVVVASVMMMVDVRALSCGRCFCTKVIRPFISSSALRLSLWAMPSKWAPFNVPSP